MSVHLRGETVALEQIFPGDSEMARRMRTLDWSQTELGLPETWAPSLRTAVGLMLASGFATAIHVGPRAILLYNDSAAEIIGTRHPAALGRPSLELFTESRSVFGPYLERVWQGETVTLTDQAFPMLRAGEIQPIWMSLTCSPLRDEEGEVLAMFVTGIETTRKVLAEAELREREARQAFLLRLGDALRPLSDPLEIQLVAMRLLGEYLQADHAFYNEVRIENGVEYFVIERDYHRPGTPSMAGRYPVAEFAREFTEEAKRGRTQVIADSESDPLTTDEERSAYRAVGVRAHIGVPVLKDGQLVGIFSIHHTDVRRWTVEEVAIVEEVAERTWAAVERARAEEALRESEKRLQRVISIETVGVLFFFLDGRMIHANKAFERMTGYSLEDLRNTAHWEVLTSPEYWNVTEQAARDLAARGETPPYEKLFIRKDGSRMWGLFAPTRLAGSGRESECVEFIIDITEAKRAEEALRETEMLQKLVRTQEDERRRIARDLHDQLGQLLTALRLKLESIKKLCADETLRRQLDETQAIAKSIDDGVDFLAWELRPAALDHLGLLPALNKYVQEWSCHSGIRVEILPSNLKKTRLLPEVETNLYRIAQEALNNVNKHAAAASVEIWLERRGDLVILIIEDDGRGFDPEDEVIRAKGLGLVGMRERATLIGGSLEIESTPGQGTTVFVRAPARLRKGEQDEG